MASIYYEIDSCLSRFCLGCWPKRHWISACAGMTAAFMGDSPRTCKLGSEIGVRSPFSTRRVPAGGQPVRNGALTPISEPNRSSNTVVGSFPRWGKVGMGASARPNLPLRKPRNWGQSPISYWLGSAPDSPRPSIASDPKCLSRATRRFTLTPTAHSNSVALTPALSRNAGEGAKPLAPHSIAAPATFTWASGRFRLYSRRSP